MPRPFRNGPRSLAEDLTSLESPGSSDNPKHIVVVMDGLQDFTMEPLKWALEYLCPASCVVTLLGVMPWLNIPLSSKTWLDIWAVEFEDLTDGMQSDVKYQKLRAVLDLCRKHGVVPQKKVAMGYPLRLLVVEQITSLHATWVVFDRHHKKNMGFYAEKIPCNMVMMNEKGEVDMIRGQPLFDGDSTPGESPASLLPTPQVIISKELKVILEDREQD